MDERQYRLLLQMLLAIMLVMMLASCAMQDNGGKSEENSGNVDANTENGMSGIRPVFSQLVVYQLPQGFVPAFENVQNGFYIEEAVPKGETVEARSQIVTLTGTKDLALNPDMTSARFLRRMGLMWRLDCPASFSSLDFDATTLDGRETAMAVFSCGTTSSPGKTGLHSETLLIAVIKGEQDYYTLQWAERGDSSAAPLPLEKGKWLERFKRLQPIKICDRVVGEKAPYPSCLERP